MGTAPRPHETRPSSSGAASPRYQSLDDDSQLLTSLGYNSGGTPLGNHTFGFGYNAGLNMTQRSVNGAPTIYSVNDFNQVTSDGSGTFTYDVSGNRTQTVAGTTLTGYTYDDENRLIVITNGPNAVPPPGGGQRPSGSGGGGPPLASGGWKSEFTYDGLSRLRIRKDYYAYSTGYYLTNTTRYLYDGKRVIQERDANNNPTVAYTRGLDLSGSLEGAGGIGGLLARSHGYSGGTWSTHNYYHADAMGNVTYVINSAQAMVASYKYDPYGRTINFSGSLAAANLYRFSSKEFHANSGLYYYL
jgi:hypothetical protein